MTAVWWDERFVEETKAPEYDTEQPVWTATVDLDDEYVRQLVLESFSRRPEWQVICLRGEGDTITPAASCSDFHWGEYERIDWQRVHQGHQLASSYCVRKGLIRKAHLAHNLRKWNAKFPGGRLARAVPETLVMVLDDIDYFEEALSDVYEVRDMADGSDVWIAKPSITNQAIGVCIFDRVSMLKAALEAHPDLREWVLQRYIQRPLLVGGRKFHLRAYALCVGSLRCYVYSEMLALFAGEAYSAGNGRLGNLSAHLTNTCHLSHSGSSAWKEDDVVKLASELPQELAAEGMKQQEASDRVCQMLLDVQDIIGCCMDAISSELTFFTLPNCFELFGFDLLVDASWNVWLLEANAEPDMKQTGKRLQGIIAGLVEGVLELVADPYVTKEGIHQRELGEASTRVHPGRWVKVLEKVQRGGEQVGASGIRMQ